MLDVERWWSGLEPVKQMGAAADWVSGSASFIAAIVGIAGYFIINGYRRADARDVTQGHIYQIGFKLSSLASEANTTLGDLQAREIALEDIMQEESPFKTVGEQQATVGYATTMARELSDAEQNMLMLMREEKFLMTLSECFARNESVRHAFVDYGRRRELVSPHLPDPISQEGDVVSYNLTQANIDRLLPAVIPAASLIKSTRYLAKVNVLELEKLCARYPLMIKQHYPKMRRLEINLTELQSYESMFTSVSRTS